MEIARQYGVEELLRPLFEFQSGPDDPMETPRKIRRPTAPKMRSESMMMMEAMNGGGVGGDDRDVLGKIIYSCHFSWCSNHVTLFTFLSLPNFSHLSLQNGFMCFFD